MTLPFRRLTLGFFPCDVHGGPFRGPTNSFYIGVLSGGYANRWRLRTCLTDAESLLGLCREHLLRVDADDFSTPTSYLCVGCNSIIAGGDTQALFVTAFVRGGAREDFYGSFHDGCTLPDWLVKPPRESNEKGLRAS